MIDVVIEQKKKNFVNIYVQDLDLSCKKKGSVSATTTKEQT